MHSRARAPIDLRALYEKRNLWEGLEELQEDVKQLRQQQEQHAAQWQIVSAEQQQHCTDLATMYQQLQDLFGEGIALEPHRCNISSSRSHNGKHHDMDTNNTVSSSSLLRSEVQELLLNFRQHIERHTAATGERLESMKSDICGLRNSVEEVDRRITRQEEWLTRIEENQKQQNKEIAEIRREVKKQQTSGVQNTDLEELRSFMLDAIQSAKNEWHRRIQELKSNAIAASETLQLETLHPMNGSIKELRSSIDALVADRENNALIIEERIQLQLDKHRQQQNKELGQLRQRLEDQQCLHEQVAELEKLDVDLRNTFQSMQNNWTVTAERQGEATISLFDTRLHEALLPICKDLEEIHTDIDARAREAEKNTRSVEERVQQELETQRIQYNKALDELCVQLKLQYENFVPSTALTEVETKLHEALRTAQSDWLRAAEEQKSAAACALEALRREGLHSISGAFHELRALVDAMTAKAESTARDLEERVQQQLEAVLNDHITRTCEQIHGVHTEMSGKHLHLVEDTMDAVAKVTQVADDLPRRVALLQEDVSSLHAALLRQGELLNEQCLHGSLQGAFDEVKDWLQDLERRTLSRGEFEEALGFIDEKIGAARRDFIMHALPERISIHEEEEKIVEGEPEQ